MVKRNWFNLSIVLCLVVVFLVSAASCKQVNATPTQPAAGGSALLNDISIDDRFQYKDYPWFTSVSDFYAMSEMDEKTSLLSQQGTVKVISDKKTWAYDMPKISMFPIFFFSGGRLTKVQLNAFFSDVDAFSACAKDLKAVLDGYSEPRNGGDTEFLDQVPPDSGDGLGSGTIWIGSDKSSMFVSTFNNSKTATDDNKYIITIQISAPGTH